MLCYGIYYTIHSCLQASTSTLFVTVYHLSGLPSGLIYIPFGVACSIASICSRYSSPRLTPKSNLESDSKKLKFVAGRVLDRDYRLIAKAQGLAIDRVCGDDLSTFPIEHAWLRTHKYSIIICASLIATYGWILRARVVERPFRTDWSSQLTRLAHSSTSCTPILDRILQPSSLHCKSPVRVQETRN